MSSTEGRILPRVATVLQRRANELAGLLSEVYRATVPLLDEPEFSDAVDAAARENVDGFLAMLERPTGEATAPGAMALHLPTGATVRLARALAEREESINNLLRAYRLGITSFAPAGFEEIAAQSASPEKIGLACLELAELGLAWMNTTADQALITYEDQRYKRLQRRIEVVNEVGVDIGTTLDITRTAQELADVAVRHFSPFAIVTVLDHVLDEESAAPASSDREGPFRMRRIALAVDPDVTGPVATTKEDPTVMFPPGTMVARAMSGGSPLHSRYGNDAPDYVRKADPVAADLIERAELTHALLVPLHARGSNLGMLALARPDSRPAFSDDDVLLLNDLAVRAALSIDNARRYAMERSTALTLQRALLPRRPTAYSAVEVASRYLPASSHTGVGGDWYDVIPLSGARVALVVGDVVGHGLYASATMGRLRTAVRTLADVDLAPDELLTHLDDVVIRLGEEEDLELGQESSATCLYAVYDPISRRCTLASAGHLAPAVVDPDGHATFPTLSLGPPLGLGGLPFEKTEIELAEGSILAMCTDGLVESRDRDIDVGLDLYREVLEQTTGPGGQADLEDVCDAVVTRMVPRRSRDDVALLLARTRALPADRVCTREFPREPQVVAQARKLTAEVLEGWGLAGSVFLAELVVSELVTNAVRYGGDPLRLRLIKDAALICEVYDGSSTSPHMRRARVLDEGGRGLLLVAQVARRWGTRYTRNGKVIWAELPLESPEAALDALFS